MFLEKVKEVIDQVQVVSFDIFDTLIIRSYNRPIDLFKHIEFSKQIKDFTEKRQSAEQKCRYKNSAKNIEEVTIDEIYDELPTDWLLVKNVEIEQEILCCSQNKDMFEVFQYVKEKGKRIFITSDMYLPQNVVEKILKNANYIGYEKLLLSSTVKKTKASGHLYEELISETGVQPEEILHIGDNLLTDNDIAQNLGIKTWYYQTAFDSCANDILFFKGINQYVEKHLPLSILKGLLIKRKQLKAEFWAEFGYQYAGLMSVGFCQWLKKNFDKDKIKTAFFMSRDGYIPQKVFNYLYPNFPTKYMKASRRCYLLSGMKNLDTILLYLCDLFVVGNSFADYWSALAIDNAELYNAFIQTFPKQERIIKEEDKTSLKNFFKENIKLLEKVAVEERNITLEYFKELGLNSENSALIDIGWRASVQKSIERCCEIKKQRHKIKGYYLGTHQYAKEKSNIKSYILKQNKPDNLAQIINPVLPLLELIYTAPEAGVVKLFKNKNGNIQTQMQDLSLNEKEKIYISTQICAGILEFTQDWKNLTSNLPLKIDADSATMPFAFFQAFATEETLEQLSKISYTGQVGNSKQQLPLYTRYNPDKTIAMIYSFPGNLSAEKELAYRFKKAAKNIGYNLVLIDNNGYILDNETNRTQYQINDIDIKFIISLHYTDYKLLDGFYYHTLWNPPENLLMYLEGYVKLIPNILSMDDFLIYDKGGMSEHLKSMLIDEPRDLERASCLIGSFPKSEIKEPNLTNPKLFYCGVNWEFYAGQSRHSGLFHLLDNDDLINIYGPEKLPHSDIRPWGAYKNYKGEIPFDGFSILDEINKCGVVLAISSDSHRRAGAVTNRIYEACAAGAVVIADDNPFVKENFKDTVLYINFNKDNPLDTYRQIAQKLNWIKEHKYEAISLAKASQKIFEENFCMELQLKNVIERHEIRKKAVANALYAKNLDKTVLVVSYLDSAFFTIDEKYRLKHMLVQINKQKNINLKFVIACNEDFYDEVCTIIPKEMNNVIIKPFKMYNIKHSKILLRAEMLRKIITEYPHNYLAILQGCEQLFSDHFTTLQRKLEDNTEAIAVHSGSFIDSRDKNKYIQVRSIIEPSIIYNCLYNPTGMFLISAEVEGMLPSYVDKNLDGYELCAFLNRAIFAHKKDIIYSNHITCGINENIQIHYTSSVLSSDMQIAFIKGLVPIFHPIMCISSLSDVDLKALKKLKKLIRIRYKLEIFLLKILKVFMPIKSLRVKIDNKITKKKRKRKNMK